MIDWKSAFNSFLSNLDFATTGIDKSSFKFYIFLILYPVQYILYPLYC